MHRTGPRLPSGTHLLALDACLAALVTAAYVALAGQGASDGLPRFTGPWWLAWPVALCVGAPLAVRRLWPLPVLAVVLGATAMATLLDITRDPYVSTALACYTVALIEPTRRASAALALTLVVSAAAVVTGEAVLTPAGPWPEAAGTAGFVWLCVGAAWAAGRAARGRRARAARRNRRLAEEALAEERLRIARELHDIVSHSLSVIVVKAAVADHVAEARPLETRDALRAIEQTGREALTEMRRALGVLRGDTDGQPLATREPGAARTAPLPGWDELPDLVRRAERAGVRTDLRTEPHPRAAAELPAGTALSVYRIVQESLTNVVKHAGDGTRCQVTVDGRRAGRGADRGGGRRSGERGHDRPAATCGRARAGGDARTRDDVRRDAHRRAASRGRVRRVRLSPARPRSRHGHRPGAPRGGAGAAEGERDVTAPVRVLVADDQSLLRGSFRVLVDTTPGLAAVGEAGTGAEAVESARRLRPDVVLMDIRMPGMDGIEATRHIVASPETAGTRVLILTTFDLDEYVYGALRAGAAGFLLKDTSPDVLLEGIRTVAAGESLLAPSVTRRLIAEFARLPHAHHKHHAQDLPLRDLTEREREVLVLVARGFSNSGISEYLHLSNGTVKTYIGRLLSKLRARDRAQLVISAYESGLVSTAHPSPAHPSAGSPADG